VDPRAGLDTEARGKILCLRRESNPDRPVIIIIIIETKNIFSFSAIKKETRRQLTVTHHLISSLIAKQKILSVV
jgi:hypothetical protein